MKNLLKNKLFTHTEKPKLRQIFLKKRLALSSHDVDDKSRQICKNIKTLSQIENKNVIACYLAVNNEPDLRDVINDFLKAKKNVVLPAFFRTSKSYKFVKLSSFENLDFGPYQIPQPSKLTPIDPDKIELVFLPGIAFSPDGSRLGYGKGVYDKLLSDTSALKIGVAYDLQVIDNFEGEPHDIKVDYLVTEKGITKTKSFKVL